MFTEHAHQLLDAVVRTRDNHLIKRRGLLELGLWSLDPESQLEHPLDHSSSGSPLPRSATYQFTMGRISPLENTEVEAFISGDQCGDITFKRHKYIIVL